MTPRATPRRAVVTGSLLAAACGLTPPDRPVSYDFRSQPDGLVFHWPVERLPVRYWAEARGGLPDYLDEALGAWEGQLLYGEFRGQRVADSAVADVRVQIQGATPPAAVPDNGPPAPACSGQTTLAVGTDNRVALPVTVTLRWFAGFTAGQVAGCLARVTAHELGHTLGLLQHSDQAGDIMYGAPWGLVEVREPSARDRAALQRLYQSPADITP